MADFESASAEGLGYGTYGVVDVTLSTDTSAYTAGDVLADTQEVANALPRLGGAAELVSLEILDKSDQATAIAMTVVLLSANSSLGPENSAPNISDTLAQDVLHFHAVASADYVDFGGSKLASYGNIGKVIKAAAGSKSLYIGAINGAGTPTVAAADLRVRLGFRYL